MINWNLDLVIGGMRKGDSFFVPTLTPQEVAQAAHKTAKDFNVTVATRQCINADGLFGLRVWRKT